MIYSRSPITDRLIEVGNALIGQGWAPTIRVRAPGRIEVIGNHVDYNGGPVLAGAIDREIHLVAGRASHGSVRVSFADKEPAAIIDVDPGELADWRVGEGGPPAPIDYACGVVASLLARKLPVRTGIDVVIGGNLPPGLGISSSAALCVGLTIVLAEHRPADSEVVLIAQEAEHRTGSPCGTMDQSASVAGGLIAYSGTDNSVTTVAADLGNLAFVVVNSGIERNLATSSYPERVREAKASFSILRDSYRRDLTHLAELNAADLPKVEEVLERRGEPTLAKRVRHVVTEAGRVGSAIAALDRGDWSTIGRLMTASGESSSRDYEISHPAVDEVVRFCLGADGVLGARMMGGGEGGAALVLIRQDAVDDLGWTLDRLYFSPRDLVHLEPKIVPCTFAQGAGVIYASAQA